MAAAAAAATVVLHHHRQALPGRIHQELEQRRLDAELQAAPVLVMRVRTGAASLQEGLRGRGLRACFRTGPLKRCSSTARARADEARCARFDFDLSAECIFEGCEVLVFEILQPRMVLPARTLGRCMLTLSDVREALGGVPLTCTGGLPYRGELPLFCMEQASRRCSHEIIGTLDVCIDFEATTLGRATERGVLRVMAP